MEVFGINSDSLFGPAIPVLLFIGLPMIALVDLAQKKPNGKALAIWGFIICVIPILGPLAYWIINPKIEGNA